MFEDVHDEFGGVAVGDAELIAAVRELLGSLVRAPDFAADPSGPPGSKTQPAAFEQGGGDRLEVAQLGGALGGLEDAHPFFDVAYAAFAPFQQPVEAVEQGRTCGSSRPGWSSASSRRCSRSHSRRVEPFPEVFQIAHEGGARDAEHVEKFA